MADISQYVPALNGEEIVQDLCGIVAEKLRTDCNLRDIDGYSGGYKASVKIHIEAYGLDSTSIDYDIEVKEIAAEQDANVLPDTVIDTEIEIPVEEDLSLVRDRSSQPTPDFEMKSTPEITAEGPVGQQPRKYTRRLKALAMAQGGAAGAVEE